MADKPSRLGRGLAALIGDMAQNEGKRVAESLNSIKRLPVDFVIANRQNPRRDFDVASLDELTNSVREKGVMQPLLVRPTDDPNIFEIIAGERRWRAAQKAGLHEVPVLIREVDDKEVARARDHRERPARRSQSAGRSPGLRPADGAILLYAARPCAGHRQEPQPRRQHAAAAAAARGSPRHAGARRADGRPCAGADHLGQSGRAGAADHRRQAVGARSGDAGAGAERGRGEEEALRPRRRRTPIRSRWSGGSATCSGSRSSIEHKEVGGRLEIRYKTLEQLDDICGKLGEPERGLRT